MKSVETKAFIPAEGVPVFVVDEASSIARFFDVPEVVPEGVPVVLAVLAALKYLVVTVPITSTVPEAAPTAPEVAVGWKYFVVTVPIVSTLLVVCDVVPEAVDSRDKVRCLVVPEVVPEAAPTEPPETVGWKYFVVTVPIESTVPEAPCTAPFEAEADIYLVVTVPIVSTLLVVWDVVPEAVLSSPKCIYLVVKLLAIKAFIPAEACPVEPVAVDSVPNSSS